MICKSATRKGGSTNAACRPQRAEYWSSAAPENLLPADGPGVARPERSLPERAVGDREPRRRHAGIHLVLFIGHHFRKGTRTGPRQSEAARGEAMNVQLTAPAAFT